eukprot:comp21146_c0_seq1/m.44794 comp21146_c0_seq1/g.44794  ORF comp21146_c0_seq1/g.44794 comp21146_c0_seq1/m.44794 type:complete len:519 (+) comp21146_c0_seq1:402-1958(+)
MRIHNNVRSDPLHRERHVLVAICHAARSLLPVTRRKLVANLRNALCAHTRLHRRLVVLVRRQKHLVHNSSNALVHCRSIALAALATSIARRHFGHNLANHSLVRVDHHSGRRKSVLVELAVPHIVAQIAHHALARALKRLHNVIAPSDSLGLGRVLEQTVVGRAEQPAVHRTLVQNDRVFLVVPRVARNRNHAVGARRQLAEAQILHCARAHQRLLRVVEHMRHRVHAHQVVGRIHTHRLLAHRTLIRVTRRLVVVRERNDRRAHPENQRRVDLAVRVCRCIRGRILPAHIGQVHRNQTRLLFLSVDKLNHTALQQIAPNQLLLGNRNRHRLACNKTLLIHNKQRPARAPGIAVDADLPLHKVAHNRVLRRNVHRPAQFQNMVVQPSAVARNPNPRPIHKHLGRSVDRVRTHILQRVNVAFLEEVSDHLGVRADSHIGHQRKILDQPALVSFRGLCGAHHAPVCVVQLANLGVLAFLADRTRHTTHVRERTGKREAIEHLRNTGRRRALAVSPVARRK